MLRRIAVTVVGTGDPSRRRGAAGGTRARPVVIALALVVFAIEYEWARRHLVGRTGAARSAADKAAASHVATASAVLFGIGAIGLGAVLIFTDVLPLSGV